MNLSIGEIAQEDNYYILYVVRNTIFNWREIHGPPTRCRFININFERETTAAASRRRTQHHLGDALVYIILLDDNRARSAKFFAAANAISDPTRWPPAVVRARAADE